MTPEELSAAVVNAPKAFWGLQEGLQNDPESHEKVSSPNMFDCNCDFDDGH